MDFTRSKPSTIEDDHESLEKYVPKIQAFCHELWPSVTKDFVIERIQRGSWNRLIGITTPSTVGNKGKSYILKIPRYEGDEQQEGLAVLRYVGKRALLSVPDIVFSDATENNPFGCPYVFQNRNPGHNLSDIYKSFNHEQRKSIAIDFGNLHQGQQAATEKKSGVVQASTDKTRFRIGRFPVYPEPELDLEDTNLLDTVSVRDTYLTLFKLQEASTRQYFPQEKEKAEYFKRLATLAKEMDDAGLFQHVNHCLCHQDLTPRNVMVDIGKNGSVKITGILNWENAIIAPCFTACKPPHWIWGEEDPEKAIDAPKTAENQQLKDLFEKIVGPQFLIYSYNAKYQLATRLFDLARHGHKMEMSMLSPDADYLLETWAKMKARVWID